MQKLLWTTTRFPPSSGNSVTYAGRHFVVPFPYAWMFLLTSWNFAQFSAVAAYRPEFEEATSCKEILSFKLHMKKKEEKRVCPWPSKRIYIHEMCSLLSTGTWLRFQVSNADSFEALQLYPRWTLRADTTCSTQMLSVLSYVNEQMFSIVLRCALFWKDYGEFHFKFCICVLR